MSLQTSGFLSTLINTGPDAMSNLYRATFLFPNMTSNVTGLTDAMTCRISNFTPPQKTSATTSVPYMGTSIMIETPGGTIDRSSSFSLRHDENYALYKFIRSSQSLKENGDYFKGNAPLFELTIEAYASSTDELAYDAVHTWKFHDCRFTSVAPVSFTYDNSSALSSNVTFIYSYFEEG